MKGPFETPDPQGGGELLRGCVNLIYGNDPA
jgi:hypothetical protein